MNLTKMRWVLGASILMLLLAACGAGTPATPTQSPDAIYTEVASTIQAAVTQTAEAMPTSTSTPEVPPTEVPTPTLPPLPTVEETAAGFPTVAPYPTVPPVAPTSPGSQTGDHAILGYQSPADRGIYKPGEEVKVTWGFLNTGTTTWTKKCYTFKYFAGQSIQESNNFPMPKDIKPGEKVEFSIAAFLPPKPGDYISRWGLYNCSKALFYEVYFAFTVK